LKNFFNIFRKTHHDIRSRAALSASCMLRKLSRAITSAPGE
jgi:hypothetical protein